MLRIEIKGVQETVRVLKGVSKRIKSESTKMTGDMALAIKRRVKKNIPHSSSTLSPGGHNTPTSLVKRLYKRKLKGGHSVGFTRVGGKWEQILPELVEVGTMPHAQPYNPFNLGHKGAAPTNFWAKSINEFELSDRGRILEKGSKKIVSAK